MIKYFVLAMCIVSFVQGRAQFQNDIPEAKPIPPNAASLFKALDRPLGTYTGTVPINFPLCRVTSGGLSANVSLNYTSTGGIRVEELASAVGLGFNLADGAGRITQQVKGLPDDEELGILSNPYEKPSTYSCGNMYHLDDYYYNLLDLEPDIYLYSFNGRSGRFTLKEDGSVALMQNDGIKITYTLTMDGFTGWTITDEKGNQYHYGTKLTNQSSYSGSNGSKSGSVSSQSWYLDSASDMNGENKLYFKYVQTGNVFTTFSGGFMPLTLSGLDCGGFNTNYEIGATVTTDGTEYLIDSIKGNSGYVVFNSVPEYSFGPLQVNSIQIYDSSGTLRDQYHFHYGAPFSSERLCLNSFSEMGASGTDSLTTAFTYNTFNNLPTVLDASVDIWGFYNNAYNSLYGLLPQLYYTNGAGLSQVWDFMSNRSANGFYAQANILTKITYPTGGYRAFTYEGNTALAAGDFFSYHPDPEYMATRTFDQTSFSYHGSSPSMQQLFTVSSYFGVSKLYYTLDDIGASCSSYSVSIMKLSSPTDLTGGVQLISFNNQPSDNFALANGYYRVDVYVNNFACTIGDLSGTWQECTLDNATVSTPYGTFSKYPHSAGGVRIQQIQDFDPVTGTTYTTSYKYKMYSTDSTLTSGLLGSAVNITATQNNSSCGCQYIKLCPGSSYPLSMEGGSYVVYPEVRTVDSAKGWTDEVFSYMMDDPPLNFPAEPPTDNSYARGRLLTQNIYSQSGTLLKKTVNSWDYGDGNYQMGVRSKAYWAATLSEPFVWREYPDQQNELPSMGDCTDFYVGMPPVVLYESIDSLFSSAGTQVSRNDYRYYVNNGNLFLQTKIAYVNNRRTKEETYRYAFNSSSDFKFHLSSGEQTMKSTLLTGNYLLPLEVVDSLRPPGGSPTFIGGSKYVFGTFNGNNAVHLSQLRAYTTASDSTVKNFTAYDSKGNLSEQYKTGDVNDSYLWGYRGMYPVAEVRGSSYSAISALVNLSVINNPSSDDAMRIELNKIRNGLSGMAQVTTYTYAPGYGMTSSTDPSGVTTYYEYDAFGRLLNVRDQYHHIVKRYNYKLNNP